MKINQISPLESDFTEVLSAIALKPKTLYYYGKLPESAPKGPPGSCQKGVRMRPKTVAIIGSRKNTDYGREVAYRAAYECAKAGVVVVSGLAYGIDSIAHRGALDAGGVTVGLLGTPINRIYPASHRQLAEEIIETGGAIMSEYGPDDLGGQGEIGRLRFLYRNRLIAGLADVVLVVEAAERSGSLNTASHALEQGKDVMAVPGNINRPYSEGCNNLLASGALVYREPSDLLELLFPGYNKRRSIRSRVQLGMGESPVERKIIEQLMIGVNTGEEIMQNAEIAVSEYNQAITMLEIRGVVKALGANRWILR